MSDLKQFSPTGRVDFLQNGVPSSSVVGARVGHEWCDYSTGTIWTCVDATFGLQQWEGDNGLVVSGITSPSHPNLKAIWTMDNISGSTLVDDSPNGEDGTIGSAVTSTTGIVGNALSFTNTVNSNVQAINPANIISNGNGAYSFWYKNAHNIDGDLRIFAVGQNTAAANSKILYLSSGPTNGDQFQCATGLTTERSLSNVISHSSGVWHHCVINHTFNFISVWVDGTKILNNLSGDLTHTATSVVLGDNRLANGGTRYIGHIDQARFFDKFLSDSEIAELYNAGAGI